MGKLTGKLLQTPRVLPRRRSQGSSLGNGSALQTGTRASFLSVKAVGSFVPKLTQKAFEKYGFSAATLLTDWAQIAGADVAAYTLPERLKWPRGAGADAQEGSEGRPGATLMLRVDPARALDVEYKSRQLIERINAYFGYRAIQALRLIQAPVEVATPREALLSLHGRGPQEPASPGDGDPLSRALARLGARVTGQIS